MPSFRLTLSYDGTDFAGSQLQPGRRTVQGELASALTSVDAGTSRVVFAGRTDRGVHAVGQVAAITADRWNKPPEALERALRSKLPSDIGLRSLSGCDPAFNPRFDAKWREYRYWIGIGSGDPRIGRYAWLLRQPIDLRRAEEALRWLRGTHDFATFASGGEGVPWSDRAARPQGTIRTVIGCDCREIDVSWLSGPSGIRMVIEFRIVADGFLPQMVRNIIGAVVEVGQARRDPDWVRSVLAAADRRSGPPAAPAHGVTLWRVGYDDFVDDW
ncbi:MAG: tRNA pseudouridine(38-40) synthase TruA [Thermomicrobiales bacterium]